MHTFQEILKVRTKRYLNLPTENEVYQRKLKKVYDRIRYFHFVINKQIK